VRGVQRQAALVIDLALRSGAGARALLAEGRIDVAGALVAAACAVSLGAAVRHASPEAFDALVYGSGRTRLVDVLLEQLGTARTAVIVYLVQQAWTATVLLGGLAPLFVWLLGASAVHAAAALADRRRPFRPLFTAIGYASGVALFPAGVATLLLEGGMGAPAAFAARLIGTVLFVWLGYLVYRTIEVYYEVQASRALTILVVAGGLFYLAPLLLIATALVAIVAAAIFLELA
jgi:hypothetical protein